jgi:hypothetical protein
LHGYQFVAHAQKATHREDHRGSRRVVKINHHVFDLTDGRVALVDLVADDLARPGASRQCRIIDAGYRCRRLRLGARRLLSVSSRKDEQHREYREDRGFHLKSLPCVRRIQCGSRRRVWVLRNGFLGCH